MAIEILLLTSKKQMLAVGVRQSKNKLTICLNGGIRSHLKLLSMTMFFIDFYERHYVAVSILIILVNYILS